MSAVRCQPLAFGPAVILVVTMVIGGVQPSWSYQDEGLVFRVLADWRPDSGDANSTGDWTASALESGEVVWKFASTNVSSACWRLRSLLTGPEVEQVRHALPEEDEGWTLEMGDVEEVEKEWVVIERKGTVVHDKLAATTRPLWSTRVLPFVRQRYNCPACTVCTSMVRRYEAGGRHRDPPHFDVFGFVTVVLELSGAEDFTGPGLYVQALDPTHEHPLNSERGDAVFHQWDLRHGVRIEEGSRYSWILWIGDEPSCTKDAQRWYGPRWDRGSDPTAAFLLGQEYTPSARGYELFREAAAQGMPYAMFNLAVYHASGNGGVLANATAAVKWWSKAAELGMGQAQAALAMQLANGQGVAKNEEAAEIWYRRAAGPPTEHAQAQLMLGELLLRRPDEDAKSEGWDMIRRAADQGVPEAREAMVQKVAQEGNPKGLPAPYYLSTAARVGNLMAMLTMGLHFSGSGSPAVHEKVRWYRKAAALGSAAAAQNLGMVYYAGEGDLAPDPDEAIEWFEMAADRGAVESAHAAGALLLDQATDARDTDAEAAERLGARAKARLLEASEKGYAKAMTTLGLELANGAPGFGGPQPEAGGAWASRAAETGNAESMWIWAQMLEEGGYGPATPDAEAARDWTRRAAAQGHPEAHAALSMGGLPSAAAPAKASAEL